MGDRRATVGTTDPVVIIGAGPVGLTGAIELARRGVLVRVVDAGAGPSTTSKAIGIHARTLEVLQRVGVSHRLVEMGLPLHSFRFHDQRHVIAELRFAEVPSAFPFALSLGQDATERVLLDRLHETGVQVEWGARLVSLEQGCDAVRLVVEQDGRSHEVRASWVIGCDGARSTVRRQSNIEFEGEPFPEWFLVADLQVDSPVVDSPVMTAGEARSRRASSSPTTAPPRCSRCRSRVCTAWRLPCREMPSRASGPRTYRRRST